MALNLPDLLGQTLEDAVLGVMHVAEAVLDHVAVELADTWWPVGADLLLQRDVQSHVKKGVAVAALWQPFAIKRCLALLEEAVVFGVVPGDLDDLLLHSVERLSRPGLAPGG